MIQSLLLLFLKNPSEIWRRINNAIRKAKPSNRDPYLYYLNDSVTIYKRGLELVERTTLDLGVIEFSITVLLSDYVMGIKRKNTNPYIHDEISISSIPPNIRVFAIDYDKFIIPQKGTNKVLLNLFEVIKQ